MTTTEINTKETPTDWSLVTKDFKDHLMRLLPLYAVSRSGNDNQTIQYIEAFLQTKHPNRAWKKDNLGNIIVYPVGVPSTSTDIVRRAMVAHTDTVPGHGKSVELIKYNPVFDVIYNADKTRPMGGDDKVGVAACLAVLPYRPDFAFYLVADEEVGCVGSRAVDIPETMLACQLDRRGFNEITESICGTSCYTKKTKSAVSTLIKQFPGLKWASGMTTDVGTLISRGKVWCGSNFACGYYNPHSSDEFIRYSEAESSLLYALTILDDMQDVDLEIARNERTSYSSNSDYFFGGRFADDEDYLYGNRVTKKGSKIDFALFLTESEIADTVNQIMCLYGETENGLLAPNSADDNEMLVFLYNAIGETLSTTEEEEQVDPDMDVTNITIKHLATKDSGRFSSIITKPNWLDNPPEHLKEVAKTGWLSSALVDNSIKRGVVEWYIIPNGSREVEDTLLALECERCKEPLDLHPLAPGTWVNVVGGSAMVIESRSLIVTLSTNNFIVCPACATDPAFSKEDSLAPSAGVSACVTSMQKTSIRELILSMGAHRIQHTSGKSSVSSR